MQERACRIMQVGPGQYVVSIVVRNYGTAEWMVAEQFDISSPLREIVTHEIKERAAQAARQDEQLMDRFQQTAELVRQRQENPDAEGPAPPEDAPAPEG